MRGDRRLQRRPTIAAGALLAPMSSFLGVAEPSRRGVKLLGPGEWTSGLVARRSKGTPPRWANHAEISRPPGHAWWQRA